MAASGSAVVNLPLGLRQALESGDCVLFLGAGVGCHYTKPNGKPAPDGKTLAEDLISHFKLDIPTTTDLPRTASVVDLRHGRKELDDFLKNSLKGLEPDQHIKWLTSFRWRAVYTTNYDMGLERAYELNTHPLQNPKPISVTSDLIYTDTHVDVPIFHLHGTPFEPCPSPMVITLNDYTKYQQDRKMVWDRLRNDCATSVMLYIGYSGRDPNWNLVVEEVAREFAPSLPPVGYRIDPFADKVDSEILLGSRRIETLMIDLPHFHDLVDQQIGDYRPLPDVINKYKDKVPPHLREDFEKNPAAMRRLLDSWVYVNNEPTTLDPNIKNFLLGTKPNWSLIAQKRRFVRDIEEPLWFKTLSFITNIKAKSTSILVTGSAGYGITTILMSLGLQIVEAKNGPVFLLKEGAQITQGDVGYAASLFPGVPCYFIVDQAQEHAEELLAAINERRKGKENCLFVVGSRKNEWLSTGISLPGETLEIEPLSDEEINRLLSFLETENALGDLKHLDPAFRFTIVKKKHEQQLLVAMREATEGNGLGFDAIIESEFRRIPQVGGSSAARQFYLLVCCFYQHGILIRDKLCEAVLGIGLDQLYKDIGSSLDGLIEYFEEKFASGEFAARARHRIIAEIVWKKCGTPDLKEQTVQKAIEKINFTYRLDKTAFDLFIRSDEIVNTFRTLEGKTRFFEAAVRQDPENIYVLQHFARMLLREGQLTLALSQIENAIAKDGNRSTRSLHHTRGLILEELAVTVDNVDVGRNWLLKSEYEFRFCITSNQSDDYGHTGLANLYLAWAKRPKLQDDEAAEYLQKAEQAVADGLKLVRDRSSLLITSASINEELGNKPGELEKLREAVASNSANAVGRYLLGRAYRYRDLPGKAIEVLEPIIRSDFKNVRAYLEYVRAMVAQGEPLEKCASTLVQCKLDGESEPAYVGLYAGLLYMDGRHVEANVVWEAAKSQHFSFEESTRSRFRPTEPNDSKAVKTFEGVVKLTKQNFVVIQPASGGLAVISPTTIVEGNLIKKGMKLKFELSFSARNVIADRLKIVG
jgi:tetratricopeptide (TPR) repeat protein